MYTPPAFVVDDPHVLHGFMKQNSFATMVSQGMAEPLASHLPLLIDSEFGSLGRLTGHMARANPHWQIADDSDTLVIFHGPHAYISPSWYGEENVVPTWNYAAVHAYGRFRVEHDSDVTQQVLAEYVEVYEQGMSPPWDLLSQPQDFIERLSKAVVAFTIDIVRLEGKWKLNQNLSAERRARVVAGLRERGQNDDVRVADLVEQVPKSDSE